jgi:hypothetical protein
LSRFSGYAALALMLVPVPLFFAYFIFIISDSIYLQFYLFYCDFSRIAIPSQSRFGYRLWVAFGSGHPLRVACGSDPFSMCLAQHCYPGWFTALLLPWLLASFSSAELSTPLVPKAMFMLPVGPDWFGAALLSCLVAALPSMILESWPMCLRT